MKELEKEYLILPFAKIVEDILDQASYITNGFKP